MKERNPTHEELSPLVDVLAQQLIQRWDLYPRQLDDGTYVTVHKPLRRASLYAHLRGSITLGTYLLDQKSQGRFLVLDADSAPDWRRLQGLAKVLPEWEATAYLEPSRRGGHLWLFLDGPRPGEEIRRFGQGLINFFNIDSVELFPKQDESAGGPGSLVRLPFGVHRKDHRRYGFYRPDGQPLASTLREQILALKAPETLSETAMNHFTKHSSAKAGEGPAARAEKPTGPVLQTGGLSEDAPLSERIKAVISVRDFVHRYVELSQGGRGLCPFHDDQKESFSVSDEKNYWHCFACDMGGSIIDFYMQMQGCDFKTAVTELAEMLLPQQPGQ